MKKRYGVLGGVALACAAAMGGCTETSETPRATVPLKRTSQRVEGLVGDAPAAQLYQQLAEAFRAGKVEGFEFGAYELEPLEDPFRRAERRAAELGLGAGPEEGDLGVIVVDGDTELRINPESGTELYVRHDKYHLGPQAESLPVPSEEYVARAREYLEGRLGSELGETELRAYKLREYVNEAAGPKGEVLPPAVYQVAVAFNTFQDGVPFIGQGGKVAIHMTLDGEVVSHESTARRVAGRIATIPGTELLSPDEAQEQVRARLQEQGVDLEQYRIARAEAGYLRLGRNSLQSVLVPHYAYFLEASVKGPSTKRLLEVIPAVRSPELLKRVETDAVAELERKAKQDEASSPVEQEKEGAR